MVMCWSRNSGGLVATEEDWLWECSGEERTGLTGRESH